MNIGVLTSYLI